jgi:hypothetical protein
MWKMNSMFHGAAAKVVRIGIGMFAVVGLLSAVHWAYWYWEQPHVLAGPHSFRIVDVYESVNQDGRKTRLYLDGYSSRAELRFEGEGLIHQASDRPYFQASVPLPGFVVAGKGKILFGSAVLTVDDGTVSINGQQLCPAEVTVTPRGVFRDGPIRVVR